MELTHISNFLAQSPVVAAIRARQTIAGFGMTEARFTPVNAVEVGKQAVLDLHWIGLDAVNARLLREVELPTISLVEIDAGNDTSNEDEIAEHLGLHSNQEHDHKGHEVGPRSDVFEVDHSGLLLALLGERVADGNQLLCCRIARLNGLARCKLTDCALSETRPRCNLCLRQS